MGCYLLQGTLTSQPHHPTSKTQKCCRVFPSAGRQKYGPTLATYPPTVLLLLSTALNFTQILEFCAGSSSSYIHRTKAKPPHTQFHYHFLTQLRDCGAIAPCANSCSKLTRTDRLIFFSRSHNPGHMRGKLGHP